MALLPNGRNPTDAKVRPQMQLYTSIILLTFWGRRLSRVRPRAVRGLTAQSTTATTDAEPQDAFEDLPSLGTRNPEISRYQ